MKNLLALLFAMILGGCATTGGAPAGEVAVQANGATELPPPSHADMIMDDRPYLIGSFDKLSISVFGIEELAAKEVQTDAAGRISFPLAGIVEAAGKTPAELEQELAARLRAAHVRDPLVTVNLVETVSQVVTIDGEVTQPGLYPVVGRMTLVRAIATAKGVSEFAKLDDVVVFRTVNGQRMAALYNLKAIRRGNYPDPEVYANDVVIVGESNARRLFKDGLQLLPALATPLIYLLTRN